MPVVLSETCETHSHACRSFPPVQRTPARAKSSVAFACCMDLMLFGKLITMPLSVAHYSAGNHSSPVSEGRSQACTVHVFAAHKIPHKDVACALEYVAHAFVTVAHHMLHAYGFGAQACVVQGAHCFCACTRSEVAYCQRHMHVHDVGTCMHDTACRHTCKKQAHVHLCLRACCGCSKVDFRPRD